MAQFYSARQEDKEDATTWGCRLEDMLDRLISQGFIQQDRASSVLRTVFWSGLRQELKNSMGHKLDAIRITQFFFAKCRANIFLGRGECNRM